MIRRRELLAGGTAGLLGDQAFAMLPVARGNYLRFRIMREGHKIGSHDLSFSPEADRLVVRIKTHIRLARGKTTLFTYRQSAAEAWLQDRFIGFHSVTLNNGHRLEAWVRRSGEGLVVVGTTQPRYIAPPDSLPTTYWNSAQLKGPMIDSQSGQLLHPKVTYAGSDDIPEEEGGKKVTVSAAHYVLTGDLRVGVWYDPDGVWIRLAYHGSDGSLITYEKM